MKTALLLAPILGAALAMPASAFAADAAPRVEVRYKDLDLATDTGLATLQRRIARAATTICGRADSRDLTMIAAIARCHAATVASTRTQVAEAITAARRDRAYAQAGAYGGGAPH